MKAIMIILLLILNNISSQISQSYLDFADDNWNVDDSITIFVNGDLESARLGPWARSGQHQNKFAIISNPTIVKSGNYSLVLTIYDFISSDLSIRPRAEVQYYGHPHLNGWHKHENLMDYWENGFNGDNNTKLWYTWSFRLEDLPDIDPDSADYFKVTMGQFLPANLASCSVGEGSNWVGPVIKFDLVMDPSTEKWYMWNSTTECAQSRYRGLYDTEILADVWYDVYLEVFWSSNQDSAYVIPKMKAGGSTYTSFTEEYSKLPEPRKYYADADSSDGVMKEMANMDPNFNNKHYFKLGLYTSKENSPRNQNTLTVYYDDIKVWKNTPN